MTHMYEVYVMNLVIFFTLSALVKTGFRHFKVNYCRLKINAFFALII